MVSFNQHESCTTSVSQIACKMKISIKDETLKNLNLLPKSENLDHKPITKVSVPTYEEAFLSLKLNKVEFI